jgi:hypothetical protein
MGRSEQIVDRECRFVGDSENNEAVHPRTRIQIDW